MEISMIKVWEEKVMIPTYEVGVPDKNPMFFASYELIAAAVA